MKSMVYIFSLSFFMLAINGNCAELSASDEKAVQSLIEATDQLASEVAKVNKLHSKEYFKKKIGEIFLKCSKMNLQDPMVCIIPRVQLLASEKY